MGACGRYVAQPYSSNATPIYSPLTHGRYLKQREVKLLFNECLCTANSLKSVSRKGALELPLSLSFLILDLSFLTWISTCN